MLLEFTWINIIKDTWINYMKKKKVAIIGTNGIPANYGGYETLSEFLVENLNERFDFTVFCSKNQKRKENGIKHFKGARLKYLPLKANGYQSIVYDLISIIYSLFKHDTLLVLGAPAGFFFFLNIFFKKRMILNHGGFNEWERTKYNKLAGWWGINSRRVATKFTTYDIGDNPIIIESIKKNFGVNAKMIEYGGDHAKKVKMNDKLKKKYSFVSNDYFITVSRAEHDNKIHEVIDAFKLAPKKNVVIVSNWKVSEYGIKLYSEYKDKYSNIVLLNAVYDKNELNFLRGNAVGYIHSHSFCGTAPSLVEAMCLGLPIISYNVPTNHYTTDDKAIFFNDSKELASIINSISEKDIEINRNNMIEIAKNRYTWERISNLYADIF